MWECLVNQRQVFEVIYRIVCTNHWLVMVGLPNGLSSNKSTSMKPFRMMSIERENDKNSDNKISIKNHNWKEGTQGRKSDQMRRHQGNRKAEKKVMKGKKQKLMQIQKQKNLCKFLIETKYNVRLWLVLLPHVARK